jgi:hypothetical protein
MEETHQVAQGATAQWTRRRVIDYLLLQSNIDSEATMYLKT